MDGVSTILVIDRSPEECAKVQAELTREADYRVLCCASEREALGILDEADVDLVMCEHGAEGASGLDLMSRIRISHPYVIRILISEGLDDAALERAIREAAIYQYVTKPLAPAQVSLLVKRALETRELSRRHRLLSRELKFTENSPLLDSKPLDEPIVQSYRFEKLVYSSPKMAELCNLAKQAAATELPILIQGGTGTGKELLARAIHYNSGRRNSPLLVQNCGGLSDEMLQSELFGHKRGAFTGAISDRLGLFRAADGGTVFLDEISEVSASFQVSLLRFLQEGEVKPLGSDRLSHADVRVIAASNRPLYALVERGEFRRDLYYRLKGFELEIPALRERPEDIPALTQFFIEKYAGVVGRRVVGITKDALEKLEAYAYPGNVRELETEIRRMVAIAEQGGYIAARHLSPVFEMVRTRRDEQHGFVTEGASLKAMVESLEKHVVAASLRRNHWNQSKAADELGLSRVGLANKIKRYGLQGA